MRIAIAVSGPIEANGACRVALCWARLLSDAGHDVALVCEAGDAPLPLPSVALHRYGASGVRSRFRRVGARRREAVRVLESLDRKARLQLVIAHDPVLSVGARRALPETPLLQTFHSCFVEENRLNNWKYASPARRLSYPGTRALAEWTERRALRAVDAVHTLSADTWRRLRTRYPRLCAATPWQRIPGAVEDCFEPAADVAAVREELGVPCDEVLLLTVRRLIPRNAVERILACARELRFRGLRARFVIVGGGPEEARLRRELARLDLSDRVCLRGFAPEPELVRWYQAADALLLPTRDLECFGMPVIEAMACGCLPLVTPQGGPAELVPDPELVAAENSGTSFIALVARCLDGTLGRHDRHALAASARRRFSEHAIRPAVLALVESVRRRGIPVSGVRGAPRRPHSWRPRDPAAR